MTSPISLMAQSAWPSFGKAWEGGIWTDLVVSQHMPGQTNPHHFGGPSSLICSARTRNRQVVQTVWMSPDMNLVIDLVSDDTTIESIEQRVPPSSLVWWGGWHH